MAESLVITEAGKKERYEQLMPQLRALLDGESDMIAAMANTSAALRAVRGFFWVGFYIVRGGELVLGPFQGPVACTRIRKGKGVCGAAWERAATITVPDVEKFPGHIACSTESKSEIVIPLFDGSGNVMAVLDVDSDTINDFDETDRVYLERVCRLLPIKNWTL